MRIRKRQVPFPISSLSPVPLSDLHLPVVQLQLNNNPHQNLFTEDDTAAYFDPPSSDQSNQPIGDDKVPISTTLEAKDCPVWLQKKVKAEGERSNDTRRESSLGAETETMVVLQQSSSSHQAMGGWGEGEKAFPLKKRRGTFESAMEKDNKKSMKTTMNKKSTHSNQEREEENKEAKVGVANGGGGSSSSSVKKRARGGALMEGSRCSRVNGRGWRCCQQTLVGYSLCEHHLGKGRLRSMTSVRSRSLPKKAAAMATTYESQTLSNASLSAAPDDQDQKKHTSPSDNKLEGECYNNEGRGEKKPLTISKRKTKLGIVKARSISSLLGQASNGEEENNK